MLLKLIIMMLQCIFFNRYAIWYEGFLNERQELHIKKKKKEQAHNTWMERKSCCSWIQIQ
jgi:hypothetical protein